GAFQENELRTVNRVHFPNRVLPYLLLAPQIAVTIVFFFWPASQALYQSLLREDAFGLRSTFVGLANFRTLFADPGYLNAMGVTAVFVVATTFCALSIALLLAVMADRVIMGRGIYRTILIWPYAVAAATAGMLWLF